MVDFLGAGLSVLAALSLAVVALSVRLGTEHGRVRDFVIISLIVNLVVMVPVVLIGFYPNYGITPRAVVAFMGAGVSGTLFGRVFKAAAIQRIGASRTDPIKASTPLFATVFAVFALSETLTTPHLAGILLIVLGVALISQESRKGATAIIEGSPWTGVALAATAAMFFGAEPIFAKFGAAEGMPIHVGLLVKVITAAIGFLGYLWWTDDLPSVADLWSDSTKWHVVAGLGNTSYLLLFYAALDVSPVVLVSPITQMSPLAVIVLSFVFLQRLERVTWRLAGAASVVVAGGVLVTIFG